MIPIEELRVRVGLEADDTSEDTTLTAMMAGALAFVETQTRRYFGPITEDFEILDGHGGRNLWLAEPPVEPPVDEYAPMTLPPLVIVDERTQPGADPITLDASSYDVRTRNHEGWLTRFGSVWRRGYEYTVTYYRGYDELPADIRELVIGLIGVKFTLGDAAALRSEAIGGYSYTRFGESDLDAVPGGHETIAAWKRMVLA